MKKNIFLAALVLGALMVNAQEKTMNVSIDVSIPSVKKNIVDLSSAERTFQSNHLAKSTDLSISLPGMDGRQEQFILIERDLLGPELKAQFPTLKSYYGFSKTNPTKKVSISYSDIKGINALVYSTDEKYVIEKKDDQYELLDTNALSGLKDFSCGEIEETSTATLAARINNPKVYRKYRLAVATDYDYNKFFAGSEPPTYEMSVAEVVKTLTFISPIYENDLSISFQLVDGLDKVTFLTKESNPYKWIIPQYLHNLNSQTQKELDTKIGKENYDIGILFSNFVGGGNAGAIGSVCDNSKKGSSYMGSLNDGPTGFNFSVAAAHEMGHQFGANHMHSRNEGANANREIGSGVTVMGYPGVTGTHDVVDRFVPQFQHYNLEQINAYLASTSCGIKTVSTNNVPKANAGTDYSIPKGTAFRLVGSATDTDNDVLTYSWEQDDPLISPAKGMDFFNSGSKNTEGANFRIYNHSTNPVAYFPPLQNVLNGQLYSTWNTVSDVARDLNFVFQVRDNKLGGGQIDADANVIKVTEAGPFKISNVNLNQSYKSGESFQLTWDVAGTDVGTINTKNVAIKLTTDDGKTFTTLVESTPNNGSANIALPAGVSAKKANLIIEAIGNVYYAASPVFAINYEVSLSCEEFTKTNINIIDATSAGAGITNVSIPVTGSTESIEDISILADFTHPASSELVLLFADASIDKVYQYAWYSNCPNPDFKYKFNKFGGNVFDNCGIDNAVISGTTVDFERYIGQSANTNYVFRIADIKPRNAGQINKLGIEVCERVTTKLGIVDPTKKEQLEVYPNPSNGQFNVRIQSKTAKISADIFNLVGQIVHTQALNHSLNGIDQEINVTHLPKGVYLVKVNDGEQSQTKKIIIR